jgi:DNA segregation ATPase FtsK/SpoIIIE, S-DNA-T family
MAKKKKTAHPISIPEKPKVIKEVRGFILLMGAFIMLLSLMSFASGQETKNVIGLVGHSIGWILHATAGLSSYFIVCFLGWLGWRQLFNHEIAHSSWKIIGLFLVVTSASVLLSLVEDRYPNAGAFIGNTLYPGLWKLKFRYHLGGAPFYYITHDLPSFNLARILNTVGVIILFATTFIAGLLFLTNVQLSQLLRRREKPLEANLPPVPTFSSSGPKPFGKTEAKQEETRPDSDFLRFVKLRIPTFTSGDKNSQTSPSAVPQDLLQIQPEANPKLRPSLSRKGRLEDFVKPSIQNPEESDPVPEKVAEKLIEKAPDPSPKKKREVALKAQSIHNGDFSHYEIPPVKLLSNPKKVDQSALKQNLKRQAEVLEETLSSFGIEAKVGQINCGPTITSFEVHPAIGVKVQKIRALENDIALNMEAKSIRIIAPIPGKAAVGIEVPNAHPQEVGFKDMLLAYQQSGQKFHIPILLGKAVNGDYVMSDLTKMPHCIIAGATGSGKSVCINTIVMSILLTSKPDEIKLIMVDPKKVELTPYTRLPHMLAPVITEPLGACAALKWLVREMESRYEILKQLGVRNIDSFNKRTINKDFEASLDREIPEKMPYIVGIIDELADLMMVASHDIETPIARIAQMARAVGIHLILATQRPSREVITGLIKANFPTRISFKVASRVNSQIVLDEIGAESLLGNGDMLFLPPGSSHLVRAQGAFIRDEDINGVVQHICGQAPPQYVIQSFDQMHHILDEDGEGSGGGRGGNSSGGGDDLYDQAKDIILGTGNASTTFLQRKLKVGYARAASLIDQLEQQGIVGPANGSKPRKILAKLGASTKDDNEEIDEMES